MTKRVISGASVLDGSGRTARSDDIFIVDGAIDDVRPHSDSHTGWDVVDATGLTVAPGFIDVHSHADNVPFLSEPDTSKLFQGVTTEVVGNCGFSLAPVNPQYRSEHLGRVSMWRHEFTGCTFAEFLEETDKRGYVTNYVPLVGHGTLRVAAMGMDDRTPTASEQTQMEDLLEEALEAGAFGMSTGLIYPPGTYSESSELVKLASRMPEHALYASHIRGEGATLLDAVSEALNIGGKSSRRVMISHHKATGKSNWGKTVKTLELIHAARERGVDVYQDVYPYIAASTYLSTVIPPEYHAGGRDATLERLTDPVSLARLRTQLSQVGDAFDNRLLDAGYDKVLIASTASGAFEGMTLAEIATSLGKTTFDALIHVLVSERLTPTMIIFLMDENDVERVMKDDRTAIGSDGLAPGAGGKPHPRQFGTFPRVLSRYVRERGVLTLQQAVYKMTALPAEIFRIDDLGLVAPGKTADLVAFDSATVADDLDYRDPVRQPQGIAWVMQAGDMVVKDGKLCNDRRGKRLCPQN